MTEAIEFPKWVKVHADHIVRGLGGVSVPTFAQHFVDRVSGAVTVLVHDAQEEARAIAASASPPKDPVQPADIKAALVEPGKTVGAAQPAPALNAGGKVVPITDRGSAI